MKNERIVQKNEKCVKRQILILCYDKETESREDEKYVKTIFNGVYGKF